MPITSCTLSAVVAISKDGTQVGLSVSAGLAFPYDYVMEAIAGDLPEKGRRHAPECRKRDDGSWLVDGQTDIDELADALGEDFGAHSVPADLASASM